MLSRRVLNRTLVYQINKEEVPPGNNQKGLLEGTPTVQLNRTLGFPNVYGQEKTNKHKTHKHFSDGPCGTIVPGTNPHPSQGQTGQNGDFTVEFNRKRPICPRDVSQFVPGTGPGLSRGRFLSVLNTVPPKMFMFIVFFSCPNVCSSLKFHMLSGNRRAVALLSLRT